MGGGKGSDQVIGYKYYLGIDFAWCHGVADRITGLYVDDRPIYQGCLKDQETIYINKPELFGEIEGGVKGYVDAEFGALDQAQNTYTVSQTGEDTPAYRGITRTVFRGNSEDGDSRSCYLGNNPYLKRITGELQRVYKRIRDGAVVDNWQNSIAGIPLIDPDPDGLGFATGVVADQSLFINVDLSSASNGYAGDNGTVLGNGLGILSVRQAIIDSLVDIRDNILWESEPSKDFRFGLEFNDSGLDIGIGYVRFTNGAQNNSSNNPNNVDPSKAPVPNVDGGTYDLPERGWIMKENANRADIDDLIAFVKEFVVVPDTVGDSKGDTRELMQLLYDNLSEAFGSLSSSNPRLRGHIVYSGFVTDETNKQIRDRNELIDALLLETAGTSDHPIKAVYGPDLSQYNNTTPDGTFGNGNGSAYAVSLLASVVDANTGRWDIQSGGWYLIARQVGSAFDGNAIIMVNLTGSGPTYTVGDRTLVDNPAGSNPGEPFGFPDVGSTSWFWGPFKDTGIYAGRFDVVEHYQRDAEDANEETVLEVYRDGEAYTWSPYNDDDNKFTLDDNGNPDMWLLNICSGYVEMNPAHIIRECLTDQQWGLGLPEADIDETSFAAAAQTLYDEKFGLSIAWTRETPIEDFINTILNHIDAVLYVDRTDGLWHLVLIRDDYDPDALDTFTDADVVEWSEIGIKSPAELVNSVTVKYNNRGLDGPASLTVNNLAQIQKLGKVIPTTVNYPGIWQDTLATRVGQRDLITLSTSLIAGEIVLTRKAYDYAPGDVFKLSSSRYNLSGEVMRVVEVNVGDGRQNGVRIKFTQDKYNFDFSEETDLVSPGDPTGEPVVNDPDTVEDRIVTEEPYYLFVKRNGEILAEEIETQEIDIGYGFVSAIAPTTSSVYARIYYDDGSGYTLGRQVPYGPSATLADEILPEADKTTVTVSDAKFFEDISANDLIQIDDEIMRIDSVDSFTQMTVARGALDTVPRYHSPNSPVFFISSSNNYIDNEFVAGDTVDVKLLDNTNSAQLDEFQSFVDTITFDSRITSPYPVGQLKLDGAYNALWDESTGVTIEATWVHRDRTLQNSTTPPVHTDSSVGPETNVNYTLTATAYDLYGTAVAVDFLNVDKNQNTSHTITPSDNTAATEGTDPWSAVGISVKTTREDSTSVEYDNWQTPEVIAYLPLGISDIEAFSGAWFDANVLSSMHQEPEKLTDVTTDGDEVGNMENQRDKF